MPSARSKPSMSVGELAVCEDFLDGHREYAIDLLSNIDKICRWHGVGGCPEEVRGARTCTVCELCSADGLLGATKKALVSYSDAETHLQEARASLGESAPSRGDPSRKTLFKSKLARAVLLCIVTVGDALRSQHTTWQARLQSELVASPSSDQSTQYINAGPGDLDGNRNWDTLLPSYSGPKILNPETNPQLVAMPAGWISETTSSSSTFLVFRRCLSGDCPCEANRASGALNTTLRGGGRGSQVASRRILPLHSNSKKTLTSKVTAKSEAVTRASGNNAALSTTTNLERRFQGGERHAGCSGQNENGCTYPGGEYDTLDTRALDAQQPQGVLLVEHAPLDPGSEMALLTQETKSSLPPEVIADPRIFRLRAQIARSDDACRALIEWCRVRIADLQLDPRKRCGTGHEASLMHASTVEDTGRYPSALSCSPRTAGRGKSLCVTGQVEEAIQNGLSRGDKETITEELDSSRWLTARKKRGRATNKSDLTLR